MRKRPACLLVSAALLLGAAPSCFDLFHSTADIRTACEVDAWSDGCVCAPTAEEARSRAAHACAWLGACETPMGNNAFGACMFQALLAYDCSANPNHRVRGTEQDLWSCLWNVRSCGDVDSCIFPAKPQTCPPGNFTRCGTAQNDAGQNDLSVRVECTDGGTTHGENCALWGQTCATNGTEGICAGAAGDAGISCSTLPECQGKTKIHWCGVNGVSGVDLGIDCAMSGAGTCGGFPTPDADNGWVACVADNGGACMPDASSTCDGGVATSCASGVVETLNCAELLGTTDPANACNPGPLSPAFDWTSPCAATQPACTTDSCKGSTLVGCARGAAFAVDCASEGFSGCTMVTTDVGTAQHAACVAPP